MTETETASERGDTSRGSGRGRSRLIVEEPDVGLDPIMPYNALSRRQTLNRRATQAPPNLISLSWPRKCLLWGYSDLLLIG